MKLCQFSCAIAVPVLLYASASLCRASEPLGAYDGRYCSGRGNVGYLRLIDQSFQFFHPNPYRQNISMLYIGRENRLCENHSWYMWWVQNSYGPTLCALPYLQEPWLTALQNAQDLWFKFQGDGKRIGAIPSTPAPDGALCDCAGPDNVIYVQGDMDWKLHDWFYEATAAGVLMQGELLLIGRDKEATRRYLPKLDRACSFIEERRDPTNNLFLVGPASNLLAPSYGGIRQPDGTFGRGYLAGLSVTYLAALDRMVELNKLVGDQAKAAQYAELRSITRDSLPRLLTEDGYFVKSIAPDGTRHGVYGQRKYGYFEVAPNVDAVCHRAVDNAVAERIMAAMEAVPELRPNGFLITNYPSLDDTYAYWDDNVGIENDPLLKYGRWVNGGVWTTMEARAIMAYLRTGRHDLALKSACANAAFARDFQLDAPLPDFGRKVWFEGNSTNLCYDALGVPAAICRGLFEYVYSSDSLTLYPHIHPSIVEYCQKEPIRFGDKRITIRVVNEGPRILSVTVNGRNARVEAPHHVALRYDALPSHAHVEITMGGAWPSKPRPALAEFAGADPETGLAGELPPDMAAHLDILAEARERLAAGAGSSYMAAFLDASIQAYDAYRKRAALHQAGFYSYMNNDKQTAVMNCYRQAAEEMFAGFTAMTADDSAGSGLR